MISTSSRTVAVESESVPAVDATGDNLFSNRGKAFGVHVTERTIGPGGNSRSAPWKHEVVPGVHPGRTTTHRQLSRLCHQRNSDQPRNGSRYTQLVEEEPDDHWHTQHNHADSRSRSGSAHTPRRTTRMRIRVTDGNGTRRTPGKSPTHRSVQGTCTAICKNSNNWMIKAYTAYDQIRDPWSSDIETPIGILT